MAGVTQTGNDLGLDRQLGRTQRQRFARQLGADAIDLEHDATRCDTRDPELRRPLARAHADFGRLGRNRHVREDADPQAPLTLDVTRDRATMLKCLPSLEVCTT